MNDDEKIIKYFSGLMSKNEEDEFNEQLKKSEILKQDFDRIQLTLKFFNDSKNLQLDEKYFINLRVRINERINKLEKKYFSKFAYTFFVVAIIILVVTKLFISSDENFINKEQITWDEYFSSTDYNEVFIYDVKYDENIQGFTMEEKLNYVHKINSLQSTDILISLPELDSKTISELESKKIL